MKKTLMTIPYFLLWIMYFMLTLKERNEYSEAVEKGMDCIASGDTGWIPGYETTYCFDPTRKPTRGYMTWGEFWKERGYGK